MHGSERDPGPGPTPTLRRGEMGVRGPPVRDSILQRRRADCPPRIGSLSADVAVEGSDGHRATTADVG